MQKLLRKIVDSPQYFLAISILLLLLAIPGLLNTKSNFTYRVWFQESDPLLHEIDLFEKEFGSSESAVIVITNPEGVITKEGLELIRKISNEAKTLAHTAKVESLTSHKWIHADQNDEIYIEPMIKDDSEIDDMIINQTKNRLSHPEIMNRFIGENRNTSLIYVKLNPGIGESVKYKDVISDITQITTKYKNQFKDSKFDIKLTGNPVITAAFKQSAIDDFKMIFPMVLTIMILFIYWQFRSFFVVFLCFSSLIIINTIMLSFCGYLNIPIHNLTAIAPEFIMAIGLADAIHIISTFFLFKSFTSNGQIALYDSLKKNFIPTIITSVTTALGFFSFLTGDIQNINDLGVIAGIGTIIAWIITYTYIAPMISIYFNKTSHKLNEIEIKLNYELIIDTLIKKRYFIFSVFFIFFCLCLYFITKLDVNSDPLKYFSPKYKIAEDLHFVEDQVGGIFSLEMTLNTKKEDGIKDHLLLRKVEEFSRDLENSFTPITKVVSLVDILKRINMVLHDDDKNFEVIPSTNEEISQFLFLYNLSVPDGESLTDKMTLRGDKIKIQALMKNLDSKKTMTLIEDIRKKALLHHLDITITGKRYLWQSINEKVVKSFITSLSIAILTITITLIIFLKDVKIGLLSIIPNVIPVAAIGMILYFTGRPLDIGSAVIASIVLGIAVDDTIHIASNYIHLKNENKLPRDILVELLRKTGLSLVTTTLILSSSFASFIFAGFVPNQNLGLLMSLGLIIALITDLFLFPIVLYSSDT